MLCNNCGTWNAWYMVLPVHQCSVQVGERRILGVCLRRWESMVTLDMRRAPDLAQRPGSDWWCADVKLDGVRLFWQGLCRSIHWTLFSTLNQRAHPHQHTA